jgi:hypothetical protein
LIPSSTQSITRQATVNKLLERQRALEERQDKVEQQAATALSALLMVHTI